MHAKTRPRYDHATYDVDPRSDHADTSTENKPDVRNFYHPRLPNAEEVYDRATGKRKKKHLEKDEKDHTVVKLCPPNSLPVDGNTTAWAPESSLDPHKEGKPPYYRAPSNVHHKREDLPTTLVMADGRCTEMAEPLSSRTEAR